MLLEVETRASREIITVIQALVILSVSAEVLVSLEGWRVVGLALVRSRIARGSGDRWIAQSEFRVRMWRES